RHPADRAGLVRPRLRVLRGPRYAPRLALPRGRGRNVDRGFPRRDPFPWDAADRVRVLRRRGSAGARDGLRTGACPRIAPPLPISRSQSGLRGRDGRQRSIDAPVRVPRVRAGRPSGPLAVASLARALRADADALGSPRGPPRAHFHRPPSRVASRGRPGLVMAGELAHARLDHRRLRRLRPRLDGPMVVEPARRASDRGPAGRADVLPTCPAVRTPRDPSTDRDPGRRARGARGLEAHRPRGRRAETGPGDRAAALPRSPRPRAHPRLERRVRRSSAVQRGSALQPAIRDRARYLPDGAHALRERRVAGGGGAFRPRLSLAGVAEIPPRPPRRQPGGHPADTGPAPRG